MIPFSDNPRRVVCAAMRREDGAIICGARHFDEIMRSQAKRDKDGMDGWISAEQGFIDNYGVFMDRREAWLLAVEIGQIQKHEDGETECLFSEELY